MGTRRAVKSASRKNVRQSTRVKGKRPSTARHSKATAQTASRTTKRQGRVNSETSKATASAPPKADPPVKKEATLRDDPVVDRRIIEGMLGDRETLMNEMGTKGYGNAAVLQRAAELGLSEALIRQVRGVAADLAGERPGRKGPETNLGARTCLSCDRVFLSTGPGNRLCMRCRGADAGLAIL